MGYEDTRQKILSTLMQRPNNTEIQPGAHQDFALSLLEYIRSVELISGSTLIGVAEEDTMPVQSNIGNESYIAGVPSQSVIVYKNFINKYGEPISVITENESKFVILFWNKQYWEKQEISISVSNIDTSKFATAEQGAKADTATAEIDALKKTVKTIEDSVVDIESKLTESFDFIPFAGLSTILIEDIIQAGATSTNGEVFFNVTTQTFIYLLDGSYYGTWLNGDDYGAGSLYGHFPKKNAVYYTQSALYEWNGSALNEIFNRGEGSDSNIDTSKFATAEQGAKADTAIQYVGVEFHEWSKDENIYNGRYLNAQRVSDENGHYVAVNIDAKIVEVEDASLDRDGLVSAYNLKVLLESINNQITNLDKKITAIQSGNTTEGIDSLAEIKSFLDGMKDTENLQDKLTEAGAMDESLVQQIASEVVEEAIKDIDGEITPTYDESSGKLTLS